MMCKTKFCKTMYNNREKDDKRSIMSINTTVTCHYLSGAILWVQLSVDSL